MSGATGQLQLSGIMHGPLLGAIGPGSTVDDSSDLVEGQGGSEGECVSDWVRVGGMDAEVWGRFYIFSTNELRGPGRWEPPPNLGEEALCRRWPLMTGRRSSRRGTPVQTC